MDLEVFLHLKTWDAPSSYPVVSLSLRGKKKRMRETAMPGKQIPESSCECKWHKVQIAFSCVAVAVQWEVIVYYHVSK